MTDTPLRSRPILLEMASIVVAVILGFAVTNWGEARRDRARADAAMERIGMEVQANLGALAETVPYYGEMRQRLDSLIQVEGDLPLGEIEVAGWRGISPPSLRTASFDVAMSTGTLEHMDFAVVDQVAVAYESIGDFETTVDQGIAAALGGQMMTLADALTIFGLLSEVAAHAEAGLRLAADAVSG